MTGPGRLTTPLRAPVSWPMAKWTPSTRRPSPWKGPSSPPSPAARSSGSSSSSVQLPFYGWFADHGHTWWVWTCLAGAGLGLIGIWYVRGRDAALKRAAAEAGPAPE